MVVVPFVAAAVYLGLIASDRYVSESVLVVRQTGGGDAAMSFSLLSPFGKTVDEDVRFLKEFILSEDMLSHLSKDIGLREHYASEQVDLFSRLWMGASREDFLDYYRRRVDVYLDENSHVLRVAVQAFDPQFAHRMARSINAAADQFVNRISNQVAEDQLAFVKSEFDQAGQLVKRSREDLNRFQDKHEVLDPEAKAQAVSGLLTTLEAELAQRESEFKGLRTYLQDGAPQMVTTRTRIDALRHQIAEEKKKVAGNGGNTLNRVTTQYKQLALETEFAAERYKTALETMEKTRIDASKRLKSLVVIASPHTPEEAMYPRRIYWLSLIFLGLLLTYGIVKLTLATIRDHID